jgi:hypothetical protein
MAGRKKNQPSTGAIFIANVRTIIGLRLFPGWSDAHPIWGLFINIAFWIVVAAILAGLCFLL